MGKHNGVKIKSRSQSPGVNPNTEALKKSTIHEKGRLSFELYDRERQCASTWQQDEIKLLLDSFRKLSSQTWEEIFRSGGKTGGKSGLGYTPFDLDGCPIKRPVGLSEDVRMSEIRASEEARIYGAHIAGVFFVVELDRGHKKV